MDAERKSRASESASNQIMNGMRRTKGTRSIGLSDPLYGIDKIQGGFGSSVVIITVNVEDFETGA